MRGKVFERRWLWKRNRSTHSQKYSIQSRCMWWGHRVAVLSSDHWQLTQSNEEFTSCKNPLKYGSVYVVVLWFYMLCVDHSWVCLTLLRSSKCMHTLALQCWIHYQRTCPFFLYLQLRATPRVNGQPSTIIARMWRTHEFIATEVSSRIQGMLLFTGTVVIYCCIMICGVLGHEWTLSSTNTDLQLVVGGGRLCFPHGMWCLSNCMSLLVGGGGFGTDMKQTQLIQTKLSG